MAEMGTIPGVDLRGHVDHARVHRRHRQPAHANDASRKTNVQRAGNVGARLVPTDTMDLRDPAFHRHLSSWLPANSPAGGWH